MRLKLLELQELEKEVCTIRVTGELWDRYKEVNRILHHQGLLFVPEVIQTKIINRHYDDPLANYFSVDKTKELINQKYYWPSLKKDVKSYAKGCDVCFGLKAVKHKPYEDL